MWSLRLPRGKFEVGDTGTQYWGKTARPAVRLRIRLETQIQDGMVSCSSVAELHELLMILKRCSAPLDTLR